MFLVFSDVGRGEDRMIDWSSEIKNLFFFVTDVLNVCFVTVEHS
jgi:hypothetical protein